MRTFALAFLLVQLAGACTQDELPSAASRNDRGELSTEPSGPFAADRIPGDAIRLSASSVHTVYASTFSGIAMPGRDLLLTRHEWAVYWEPTLQNTIPRPPLPEVDFERRFILAAAMGSRLEAGHSIEIDEVWTRGDDYWVRVIQRMPAAHCNPIAIHTLPIVVVSLPRITGDVFLVERVVTEGC
jgi:hypothetical protein